MRIDVLGRTSSGKQALASCTQIDWLKTLVNCDDIALRSYSDKLGTDTDTNTETHYVRFVTRRLRRLAVDDKALIILNQPYCPPSIRDLDADQ